MKTRIGVMPRIEILRNLNLVAAGIGLTFGVQVSGSTAAPAICPPMGFSSALQGVVPDGRETAPFFLDTTTSGNNTVTNFFVGGVGRSYSVETRVIGNVSGQPSHTLIVDTTNGCNPSNSAGVVVADNQDPTSGPALQEIRRANFIFQGNANGNFIVAGVRQNAPFASFNVVVRVSETTLYQPLWGTTGGFHTFWNIQNTSALTCNATLTLKSSAGAPVMNGTVTKVIPAGGSTEVDTIGLGVALNQVGNATIAHDCSPGALAVDTFLENVTTSNVLPAKIFPIRESMH